MAHRDLLTHGVTRRRLVGSAATVSGGALAGMWLPHGGRTLAAAQDATPVAGGTLRIGIRNYDYDILDPHQTGFTQVYYMIMNIVEPLVQLAPDATYQPGLATAWEVSPDATTWTFNLRDDVTFHDGTPFNAEAVQFNFDRMVNPETGSRQAGPRLGTYNRTEVIDDYTVEVVFDEPYAVALNAFSSYFCGMVSPAAVEEYGDEFPQHVTGTGPFVFESEDPQVLVTMVRNDDYNWAPAFRMHQGPAYLDAIHFQFIPEDGTRLTTLQTAETDMIDEIPVSQVAELEQDPNYVISSVVRPGIARAFHLNIQLAPTDDLAVRQAMNHALDRATMETAVFQGIYPVETNVLVAGTMFYDEAYANLYPYDPDGARALLDEAGWVPGADGIREKDGVRLEVNLATFPGYVAEVPSELAQAQYAEVGIGFNIEVMTGGAMMEGAGAEASPYNAALSGTYDFDPGTILRNFYHSSSIGNSNYSHVSDPELDDLLDEGLAIADTEERAAIYSQIQAIIMENAFVVPMYGNVALFGSRAAVQNLIFDPNANPVLFDVFIEGA